MFPFEKLAIYQRGLKLVSDIEDLCKDLKGKAAYPILDQLTRAALSIPLNIAEGNGRKYKKEKVQFLRVAKGSLFEMVPIIQILAAKDYIAPDRRKKLYDELEIQTKMVTNLINYLEENEN